MDIILEIGEFNKYRLNELLRLIDKIKYNDVKEWYYSSPSIVAKDKCIFEYMKYYNVSKELLEKTLKDNSITYDDLSKLTRIISFIFLFQSNTGINPLIKTLIFFYLYNFIFDIDYILQKKLNSTLEFSGYDINVYNITNPPLVIKFKTYLSKYTYTSYTDDEKEKINNYEKSLIQDNRDGKYKKTFIAHPFLKTINAYMNFSTNEPHNVYGRINAEFYNIETINNNGYIRKNNDKRDVLYLNILPINEQKDILDKIYSDIKKVFDKQIKRAEYLSSLQDILQSESEDIDHLVLYETLDNYLETFENKEELNKLNNEYKFNLGFYKIQNKIKEVINILTKVSGKITDNNLLNNITRFIISYLQKIFIDYENNIIDFCNNIINLLLSLEEIRILYNPSYFDISNSNTPIENLNFIINIIHKLFDYLIEYIDYNYMPTITYLTDLTHDYQIPQFGGEGKRYKKILKKYK